MPHSRQRCGQVTIPDADEGYVTAERPPAISGDTVFAASTDTQIHAFDALTPLQETLRALDDLVSAGKVRYIGCSNYAGWQLMKALSISDKYGYERYISHQLYYSLCGRDADAAPAPRARPRQCPLAAPQSQPAVML